MEEQDEIDFYINEIKTLILIGGIPLVIFILSSFLTELFLPQNTLLAFNIIGGVTGLGLIISIIVVIIRVISMFRKFRK